MAGRPLLELVRDDIRSFTASVDAEVLRPHDDAVVSRADRLRVAICVAAVNNHQSLLEQYAAELDTLEPGAAAVVAQGRWTQLPERTAALLEHAEQVALDPAHSGEEEIGQLVQMGITATEIVVVTQIVGYVSYRTRLLAGLSALAVAGPGATTAAPSSAQQATSPALPTPSVRFPTYRWRPFVDAPAPPEKKAGADARTPKKWSPFYLTLLHDPRVLGERTALYDAIMTGTGKLDRADRELAALATSLTTGCEYCASVHGRRQVQLSKDQVTAVLLAEAGPSALADPRQRTVATVAAKIAPTPPTVDAADVDSLRSVGLDDPAIADFFAVSAMFAWANRLMMTLGQAELPPSNRTP